MIVLFNKPFRVLSQFTPEGDKACLADYIDIKGVYPAGRLDFDSEGLLLLTDDGRLQHRIAHPKFKAWKEYWVQVEGAPTEEDLEPLRRGVVLKDGPTKPARASLMTAPEIWERTPPIRYRKEIPAEWIRLSIREGRNRQVRRMTASIGFPTLRLVRYRVGDWSIEGIPNGEYRVIDS